MAEAKDTTELSGLQISNSTFSASPPGSLLVAENVVMPQKGVIEPRNGQSRACVLASASSIPFALAEFQGHVLANYATSKTSTAYGLGELTSTTITPYTGTFNPVDDDGAETGYGRMKFGHAGTFLHFCTTTGPKALEEFDGEPRSAGLLRMPDPLVQMISATNLGSNGVGLAYGSSRAYRTVLRLPTEDAPLTSPPSGRMQVTNRLLAAPDEMVRTGGNLVTVTLSGLVETGLDIGDTFTVDPGEANFAATAETVVSAAANVITYTDVGANVANTLAQDLDTGERPVGIFIYLSEDATVDTPIRIYRTADTTTTSPGDEMFLVDEVFPSSGDLTAGYIYYEDIVPESQIIDPLYTNPLTGAGEKAANDAPPIYRDVASWGERQWYANTTGLQSFNLQMLGVGSPNGVQNNDTLIIDVPGGVGSPYTFTFKTAPAAPGDVLIVSNGLPSENITLTSQFLILQINEVMVDAPDTPVRAYYTGSAGSTGTMLIQATSYAQAAFTVTASRAESWIPSIGSGSLLVSSEAERATNRVMYSKLGEPEAVPLLNLVPIGSKNYAVARILGLQQALLAFKEGDGIYAITGGAPFNVQQISTANILAPDAAGVFADSAWVYTDQGLLRVSDSGGAVVVSRQIETALNEQLATFPDEVYDYAFMVPYEVERRLMFFMPFDFRIDGLSGGDLPNMRAWCYNNATQSWTGPLYADVFSGIASSTVDGFRRQRLYLGMVDYAWSTTRITVERSGNTPAYKDILDGAFTTSITAIDVNSNPLLVELASLVDVEAGDLLSQTSVSITKIAALRPDVSATCVEVYEDVPFTVASCAIGKRYDCEVQFQPQGNPSARKTLSRLAWLFKPEQFATLGGLSLLSTDQCQENLEIDTPSRGFGLNAFGTSPFGDPSPMVVDVNPLGGTQARPGTHVNAAQFFPGFRLSEAYVKFRLQGFVLTLDNASGPAGRGR